MVQYTLSDSVAYQFQNRRSRTKSVVSEPCPRTKFFDNTRQSTISKMENEELEGDEHTLVRNFTYPCFELVSICG